MSFKNALTYAITLVVCLLRFVIHRRSSADGPGVSRASFINKTSFIGLARRAGMVEDGRSNSYVCDGQAVDVIRFGLLDNLSTAS